MVGTSRVLANRLGHCGECVEAFDGDKRILFDYHPAKGKNKNDRLVVISPGWLGSMTFNGVAKTVAESGHNVAVVSHAEGSLRDILHPNKSRAKRVHAVTKAAVEISGIPKVHIVDHSNGHRDVVEAVKYQTGRDSADLTYEIERITAMDGVGSNGMNVNIASLHGELVNFARMYGLDIGSAMRVLGYSAVNLVQRPVLSAVEGISAMKYDARPDTKAFEEAGIEVVRIFHDNDSVIRVPVDPDVLSSAVVLSGGHLSAATNPETVLYAVA